MNNWVTRSALGLVLGFAACNPAAASDLSLPNILTPLTDPTDDWKVRKTVTGQPITLYGQISQALLHYNDGALSRGYGLVDNSNASTRIGFFWQLYPIWGLDVVFRAEGGITPRAANAISQTDTSGDGFSLDGTNVRKLELILDSKRIGTLMLGQGSMATDGIAEIDFSQTAVTAYSNVAASAGGMLLRQTNGALSVLTIGDVFQNFDGDNVTGYNSDGSRKLRIRYDTPRFHGLTAAFAVGTDVFNDRDDGLYADAALRWQFDTPDLKLSAGAGYSVSPNDHELSGSMSGVHKSTGGTVTLALGQSDLLGRYHFVKLGLIRQWIPQGDTSFSMDYYDGTDIGGAGSRSKSFGLAIVQQFSKHGIEAFALWRHYDFDAPAAEYFGSTALFAGARWKF